MRFSYLYKLLIISFFIGTCSCNHQETAYEETEEEHKHAAENTISLSLAQHQQANITLALPQMRSLGYELKVNGIIDVPPQSNVSVAVPYGGFLKHTKVLPGTQVKKGELLAIIENPDFIEFQKDYLQSLARQDYLEAEYIRQKELFEQQVAAGKTFQQAKSENLANRIHIQALEEKLKLIGYNLSSVRQGNITSSVNLYSPVTGSVRQVHSNIGRYVSPQDVIMSITNAEDLHVELTVYENDVSRIKKGQQIRFTTTNQPNVTRLATVFLIGSGVREDRSVTVHGHLAKEYPDLLPGMYISANVETDTLRALTVPNEAIVRYAGLHYVFAIQKPTGGSNSNIFAYQMVEVEPGISESGFTVIQSVENYPLDRAKLAVKGAFTLLAALKNTEEEGGGHGH